MALRSLFTNAPLLVLSALAVVGISLYADSGQASFDWFQRSGSFMVLSGAVLSYRSIVAKGVAGVGAPQAPTIMTGNIIDTDDGGDIQKVSFKYDESSLAYERELAVNRVAGFFGALFIVCGTLIWGYGDLVGQLF